jgi:hypothetical protein
MLKTSAMCISEALNLKYDINLENIEDPEIVPFKEGRVFYGDFNFGSTEYHKNFMREWHMNNRTPEWNKRVSDSVKESYNKNPSLKNKRSERVSQTWNENYEVMKSIAKNNLPMPMFGKDNPNATEIEYKGKLYYGWRELQEATGVTKHLYRKYYINGIDPENRINANGPTIKKKENQ